MNLWMSMKASLTVMDLVTRGWARQLGLDECGVMVLMLMGQEDRPRPAAELALFCGRARQQVHRALKAMEELEQVRPATVSLRGQTTSWGLTEKGRFRWGCLARAVKAWEETLELRVDLAQLKESLRRIVEMAVNRPGADGWKDGLLVPSDLVKVPLWFEVAMEETIRNSEPLEELPTDDEARRAERERARAEREWEAMWMRISS